MDIKSNIKVLFKKALQAFNHHKATFDRKNKILILLYHRVLENDLDNPLGTIVSKNNFENQIKYLSQNFEVTSLDRALSDPPNKLKAFINRFDRTVFGINYDSGNSAALGFSIADEKSCATAVLPLVISPDLGV